MVRPQALVRSTLTTRHPLERSTIGKQETQAFVVSEKLDRDLSLVGDYARKKATG